MKHLFRTLALSIGLGASLPPPALAAEDESDTTPEIKTPKTTIDWLHFNTDCPTGVIGIFGGPLVKTKFSDQSSTAFMANVGGCVTFKQDENTTSAELSPAIKVRGRYEYSLGRLLLSLGLSASQTSVNRDFYGTHKIYGATGDAAASFRVASELELFASTKLRVLGNLPDIKTVGASFAPFIESNSILKGTSLTFLYTQSTNNNSADRLQTKSATAVLGYEWKSGQGTAFGGIACSHIKMDQALSNGSRRSVGADICIPAAGFTVSY